MPLAAHIRRVLDERASHAARKSRFIDELEDFMGEEDAEQTLRAMISLARYAEAFAYDDETRDVQPREPRVADRSEVAVNAQMKRVVHGDLELRQAFLCQLPAHLIRLEGGAE